MANGDPVQIKAHLDSKEWNEVVLADFMISEFKKDLPATRERKFISDQVIPGELPQKIDIDVFRIPPILFTDEAKFKLPALLE